MTKTEFTKQELFKAIANGETIGKDSLHYQRLKALKGEAKANLVLLAIKKGQTNTVEALIGQSFNKNQVYEIRLGLEKGLDVSVYADTKFDWVQMGLLRFGLENNINVSEYVDTKVFNGQQMYEIHLGLEKGLDVSTYAKPEFDYYQMHEIHLGLENGLDVSAYTKPELDHLQMRKIRFGLEQAAHQERASKEQKLKKITNADLWADMPTGKRAEQER